MSNVLDTIVKLYNQGFIEKEFELDGHKYVIRTLNEHESVWRDQFVPVGMTMNVVSAKIVPTLAVAIKSIDGVAIESQFSNEGSNESFFSSINEFSDLSYAYKFKKVLQALPHFVILRLYEHYQELEKKEEEAIKLAMEKLKLKKVEETKKEEEVKKVEEIK